MELRRTLTGGLAWVGLVIVVAVPAVEAVRSKLAPTGAGSLQTIAEIQAPAIVLPSQTPSTPELVVKKTIGSATTPASVVHAAPPVVHAAPKAAPMPVTGVVAATVPQEPKAAPSQVAAVEAPARADAVPPRTDSGKDTALDQYLATGKPLPSYVKASPAPAIVAATPVSSDSTQGSDTGVTAPAQMASADESGNVAEPAVAAMPPPVPMPVAARPKTAPQRLVTEADLKGWKSGSLADYLRQRGLLSPAQASDGSSN